MRQSAVALDLTWAPGYAGTPALRHGLLAAWRQTLALQKLRTGQWTIHLVGDTEMRRLHWQYMRLKSTTDVLTFDLRDTPTTPGIQLDSVLCVDEAQHQAKIRGLSLRQELLLYGVHSLLHVCGYDDLVATEAQAMHRREDEIMEALGEGTVYARPCRTKGSRVCRT
ncbi:MAG: rRNA maturation RNase YbeY [Phycisphaerae bacterium]